MSHQTPSPLRLQHGSPTPHNTTRLPKPQSRLALATSVAPLESRRIGLPSSPRQHLNPLPPSTSLPSRSKPSSIPRPVSTRTPLTSSSLSSKTTFPDLSAYSRPLLHQSRSEPEDVPLWLNDASGERGYIEDQDQTRRAAWAEIGTRTALDTSNDTVLGVPMPGCVEEHIETALPPQLIPELQSLVNKTPRTARPPPPPSVSTVSSPSTRFTESPAPWSASTATTTPVSWSSTSPALTQSHRPFTTAKSNTVPAPHTPRTRPMKLPPVPKTITAPKAEATVVEAASERPSRPRRKKSILDSPAPTPPPRKSSVKRLGKSNDSSLESTPSRVTPLRPSTAPGAVQDGNSSTNRLVQASHPTRPIIPTISHGSLQQSIRARSVTPGHNNASYSVPDGSADAGVQTTRATSQHARPLDPAFEEHVTRRQGTSAAVALSDSEHSANEEAIRRSPSRLGKFSRMRLFSRGTASDNGDKTANKLQRRGPAAGTGHEGYGKYSRRGRKQSSDTSGTRSDSERSQSSSSRRTPGSTQSRRPSTTSRRTSQSEVDEFAVPRLQPFVMRGGSQTNVDAHILDNERAVFDSPLVPPLQGISPSPSADDILNIRKVASKASLPDRSVEGHELVPGLALRRSQRFGADTRHVVLPAPIEVRSGYALTPITSYDQRYSSAIPTSAAPSVPSSESSYIDPSLLKEKKSRRRWWNPFRSRSSPVPPSAPAVYPRQPQMAVSVVSGPPKRSIPYYAILGSESEVDNTLQPVGDILAEAAKQSATPPEQAWDRPQPDALHVYGPASEALPSPSNKVSARAEQLRQPRLAQIGRIPQVVNRSERTHKPSRQSFSQPFVSHHPHDLQLDSQDDIPQLQIHTDLLPSRPFRVADELSAKPASAPVWDAPRVTGFSDMYGSDLVPTTSLHYSERSTSSCSAGLISVIGPTLLPDAGDERLSRLPSTRQPSVYGEEDVWNEYDDIIDQVMSPSRSPGSKTPDTARHHNDDQSADAHGLFQPLDLPPTWTRSPHGIPPPPPRRAQVDLTFPPPGNGGKLVSSPTMPLEKWTGDDIRLRRSRIISALHSSYDPTSPFSMQEFLKDYSDARDSLGLTERLSTSTTGGAALVAASQMLGSGHHRTHSDDAFMLDIAQRNHDPAKQSELHYASLEVSRWLSFGRVLFSPAQNEIYTLPDRNVLVIDGLGSEDWSIYCAVTYELHRAVVYDLKEKSRRKQSLDSETTKHLPLNYRRSEVSSYTDRFPFHSAFFSVVVLRFPPAMSEVEIKNIITECRRVLVPGGHIEVMLLEFDFVNMGVVTRRAIRELKMRVTTQHPEVNLKPTIDHFQSILGSRGFTGLSRCVVGVPVVGQSRGSGDSIASSRSSAGSLPLQRTESNPLPSRVSQRGHNFSLSDLVADPSERADAQIGRMVSTTARSWWQHCYEASVLPRGDVSRSIFAEKRVMQECGARASSFKLLIAYAQRPVFEQQARRRTMSESAAGSLATAGGTRRTKPS